MTVVQHGYFGPSRRAYGPAWRRRVIVTHDPGSCQLETGIRPGKTESSYGVYQLWRPPMNSSVRSHTPPVYRGEQLRAVAMPLGGIGTGSVALCGDGSLRQWQLCNNV